MNHLLPPCVIATLATAANALELGPQTPITLGSSLAVGVVVVGGAYWVGRFLQRVDDRLTGVEKRLKSIEQRQQFQTPTTNQT